MDDERPVLPHDLTRAIPLLVYLQMRVADAGPADTYSVEMELGAHNANFTGNPHGGALAALIDHTGGHAASRLCGRGGPTVDLHVRFLTTPRHSTFVRATASIVREGRSLIVVAVDVRDEQERLIATGSLTVAPRAGRPEPAPD